MKVLQVALVNIAIESHLIIDEFGVLLSYCLSLFAC